MWSREHDWIVVAVLWVGLLLFVVGAMVGSSSNGYWSRERQLDRSSINVIGPAGIGWVEEPVDNVWDYLHILNSRLVWLEKSQTFSCPAPPSTLD